MNCTESFTKDQALLFNVPKPLCMLAWNAPVHILHLSSMDILGAVFWLWRVGFPSLLAYLVSGQEAQRRTEEFCKIGGFKL